MGVEDIMGAIKFSKRRYVGCIIGSPERQQVEMRVEDIMGPSNLARGDVQDKSLEEQTTGGNGS